MNSNIFKQIRINEGISQKEFSEILGLSQTFVSLMENGKYAISNSTKRKVFREFDITEEILDQIDRLSSFDKGFTNEEEDKDVGGVDISKRISEMINDVVETNLAIHLIADDKDLKFAEESVAKIPERVLKLVEKELSKKIDASISAVIGSVIDEYIEYADEINDGRR